MTVDDNNSAKLASSRSGGAGQTADVWPKGVSKPAQRALAGAGYTQLEQLRHVSEAELLALHGMGPKAIGALREALAAKGLTWNNGGQA